jgi:glycosyltransferase involved in cell wall biosynthesis
MPAYNEAATIAEMISKVQAVDVGFPKEIIIVDDASVDGTRDALNVFREMPDVRIIFHERNRGKGAAIRTALAHVTGDIVVIQDADLEYDPEDLSRLIRPIASGKADVVYGNRFHGEAHRVLYFWHSVGNAVLTLACNMVTNLNLSDMEVGYKAFRADVICRMRLRSDRFGFEPNRRLRRRWQSLGTVSLKSRSLTTAELMPKARRLHGRTALRRCGVFFGTELVIDGSALLHCQRTIKPCRSRKRDIPVRSCHRSKMPQIIMQRS